MRLAVTYDNGNVFQHFGRTENFKVYEIEAGQILSSRVVSADGAGHEALADVLSALDVQVLICGGLGEGAKAALDDKGIIVFAGAEGDADDAVRRFLSGELTQGGVNCDHHESEEEGCGGSCGGNCGSGCGGCGGNCGTPQILYEGPNAGKTCFVHYKGTFNDGTQFDSSYDRGEPLQFVCAVGMMIPGFDKAVVDMEPGQIVNIHLMPEEAYGEADPQAIFTVNIADLPGSENLSTGERVYLSNNMGQQFPVTVTEKTETTITFDANHEMAGKELNFMIELVEVRE